LTAEKAEEVVKEIKKGKPAEDVLESSLNAARQEKEREESKRNALVKKMLDFCPKNVTD